MNKVQMLLVEDDVDIATIVMATLGSIRGLQITRAGSASDALLLCRQRQFDIAILDYHMPGMNGDELQRALHEEPSSRGLPVAFLTANPQSANRTRLKEQGAVAVFSKPFKPAELRDQIGDLLMALGLLHQEVSLAG